MTPFLPADWPAPPGVRGLTTLRHGAGRSAAPFDTFNLGNRTAADGDDADTVDANRRELAERLGLASPPRWLRQVHGTGVVRLDATPIDGEPQADAAVTSVPGVAIAILTADCLPVLFCSDAGDEVAGAHAGWRGLADGVLEATLAAMRTGPSRVMAWLGPAAGPARYEVGEDVHEAFVARDAGAASAFVATRPGHWHVDLPGLARRRLVAAGLDPARIHGGTQCTIADPARFYSHRRDRRTGRMASLVWIAGR